MGEQSLIILPDFTKSDFITTTKPYEWLYQFNGDKFILQQMLTQMKDKAKNVGIGNFTTLWKSYIDSRTDSISAEADNTTNFEGQEIELASGEYNCSCESIFRFNQYGEEIQVCNHPIMPVRRLINVDTSEVKYEIAFKKYNHWQKVIVDKYTLANTSKIVELSKYGISVDSENAKEIVKYFTYICDLNENLIPTTLSVGRLGFIENIGFSPYVENAVFDGNKDFKKLYESVHTEGSFETWKETAITCREMSTAAKVELAAAFASPLLAVVNCLPFFVHLWSSESGTGKTVALMLAASVWGNPSLGEYVKTFNSTEVGSERTAAFLNHLPLCLDELQLIKNSRGVITFNPYQLAQGIGRQRGNKSGGVDALPTWRNIFLTTGESPLTSFTAGAGAYNRIIEIECLPDKPVISEGNLMVSLLTANFGHAGRCFVKRLYSINTNKQSLIERYNAITSDFIKSSATDKQALSMAVIKLADELMCEWIFDNKIKPLESKDLLPYFCDKEEISVGKRAYDYLCEWVTINSNKFTTSPEYSDVWGVIDDEVAYIISSKFREALENKGFDYRAVSQWLIVKNKVYCDSSGKLTKLKKINKQPVRCVALKLTEDALADFVEIFEDDTF